MREALFTFAEQKFPGRRPAMPCLALSFAPNMAPRLPHTYCSWKLPGIIGEQFLHYSVLLLPMCKNTFTGLFSLPLGNEVFLER
jgi:hypothetical protein